MPRMLAYAAMKRLICIAAIAFAPALMAQAPKVEWKPFEARLEPRKSHEECVRLEAGDKRRYSWKANSPVDYNIHYHQETEVFYPVKRDGMRGDGGEFTAKTAQEYCWMWTARGAAAKVEGRIEGP